MSTTTHIHVRNSRDRLAELLRLGDTYPLEDVQSKHLRLKVPYDTAARIPIDHSQTGVLYQLYDMDGQLVEFVEGGQKVTAQVEGNGQRVRLTTPKIKDEVTYRIRAQKIVSKLPVVLDELVTITVGLDTTLDAAIATGDDNVQLLDPSNDNPATTDPRIVDYGVAVNVDINESQEGVDYRLVCFRAAGLAAPFQAEIKFSEELDRREFSESLRQVFEQKVFAISASLEVRVRTEGHAWWVIDAAERRAFAISKHPGKQSAEQAVSKPATDQRESNTTESTPDPQAGETSKEESHLQILPMEETELSGPLLFRAGSASEKQLQDKTFVQQLFADHRIELSQPFTIAVETPNTVWLVRTGGEQPADKSSEQSQTDEQQGEGPAKDTPDSTANDESGVQPTGDQAERTTIDTESAPGPPPERKSYAIWRTHFDLEIYSIDEQRSYHESDEWLMEQVALGRGELFAPLIRRYSSALLTFIRRMVGDCELREKVFEDVIREVWRRRHEYQSPPPFKEWLFDLAAECCRAEKVRQTRIGMPSSESLSSAPAAAAQSPAEAAETERYIAAAIGDSPAAQRGEFVNRLQSRPMQEDTDIWIRATKVDEPAEEGRTETVLLDAVLPLKVRSNPALEVSVVPSPIIGYGKDAMVTIDNTQTTANYIVYARPLTDRDFVTNSLPDTEVITVAVEGSPNVRIRRPQPEFSAALPDFKEVDESQQGTGDELEFRTKALKNDQLVIAQARKEHQAVPDAASAVQLAQAAVILVQPDSSQALRLRVPVDGSQTSGAMQVFNGQPGVIYHFRRVPDGIDIALPACFPLADERKETAEQPRVEVEFVVATERTTAELAGIVGTEPILETGPQQLDATLYVRAVAARTGVATLLHSKAHIPAAPNIFVQNSVIGMPAEIVIASSAVGDKYQLLQEGNEAATVQYGNGQDLAFLTPPMFEDAVFEILITRPEDQGITVERVLTLTVIVKPDAKLTIEPGEAVVDHLADTQVKVETSQLGVSYQLTVDDRPVGDPVTGTGDAIILATGPLAEDTIFVIRATRISNRDVTVNLEQHVSLTVRPDTKPGVSVAETQIDYLAETDVQVAASQPGVTYQLTIAGDPVGQVVPGNGNTIALPTGPLAEDTTFVILARRVAKPDITAELLQQVTVAVRFATDLVVNVADRVVDYDAATAVQIAASQPDVSYQLTVAGSPVGEAVEGNREMIFLPTGRLTNDTTFVVRATRMSNTNIVVDLWQRAVVIVRPNTKLDVSTAYT